MHKISLPSDTGLSLCFYISVLFEVNFKRIKSVMQFPGATRLEPKTASARSVSSTTLHLVMAKGRLRPGALTLHPGIVHLYMYIQYIRVNGPI